MSKISFFSLAPKLDRYFKSSLEQFGFSFYFIKEYFSNETIDSRRKETSRARIVRLSLKIFKIHDTKKKKSFETSTDYRRTCKRGKATNRHLPPKRNVVALDYSITTLPFGKRLRR